MCLRSDAYFPSVNYKENKMSMNASSGFARTMQTLTSLPSANSSTGFMHQDLKKNKKNMFEHGQVYIALEDNKISFMAGEVIKGAVFVQQ